MTTRSRATQESAIGSFFRFKTLLFPQIMAALFAAGTILCAIAMCVPILLYYTQYNTFTASLAPYVDTVASLKDSVTRAEALHTQAESIEREIAQYSSQTGYTLLVEEKKASLREVSNALVSLARTHKVNSWTALKDTLDSASRDLAIRRQAAPSIAMFLLATAAVPFVWICYRIVMELAIIAFSIHDRLVELVDKHTIR